MDISFNRNEHFSEKEVEFITRVLSLEYQQKLGENQVINVLRPIHPSQDVLPHFTFRIWDNLIDVHDIGFARPRDLHGYVWEEQNGELTLEFITTCVEQKYIVS